MKNPNVKTTVVHSQSKAAWNVIGVAPINGGKYKIARVPYQTFADEAYSDKMCKEALEHAEFISWCFNNADSFVK